RNLQAASSARFPTEELQERRQRRGRAGWCGRWRGGSPSHCCWESQQPKVSPKLLVAFQKRERTSQPKAWRAHTPPNPLLLQMRNSRARKDLLAGKRNNSCESKAICKRGTRGCCLGHKSKTQSQKKRQQDPRAAERAHEQPPEHRTREYAYLENSSFKNPYLDPPKYQDGRLKSGFYESPTPVRAELNKRHKPRDGWGDGGGRGGGGGEVQPLPAVGGGPGRVSQPPPDPQLPRGKPEVGGLELGGREEIEADQGKNGQREGILSLFLSSFFQPRAAAASQGMNSQPRSAPRVKRAPEGRRPPADRCPRAGEGARETKTKSIPKGRQEHDLGSLQPLPPRQGSRFKSPLKCHLGKQSLQLST
uniref:Chromo domain-containing protein n=1 Tax=Callithrix jacchus TaxID=9483 RepID=A0A5F4WK69_CALJA